MAQAGIDLRVASRLIVAIVLGGMVCTGSTSAQTPPPQASQRTSEKVPGWSVNCVNAGKGLVCKAVQKVVLAKNRRLLLSVSVSKPAGRKNAAMLLQVPLGLFNPAGVTVAIDKAKPEILRIQTCDRKGCYAGTALTPEKLGAMTKGQKLNVIFQDLKKKKITVAVPLKGFEQAYKKL